MINGKVKVLIIVLICCVCFSSCSKRYSSTKEDDYEKYINEVVDAELYMPKLENLGDYESILVARRTNNDAFIDTTESVSLIVKYSKDNFDLALNQLEEKYEFLNSALDNYQDYEAEINNYYFRVDYHSLYEMISHPSGEVVIYPKCSLIIGVNNSENKIAYLYYWDIEKDEMNDLDKFIEEKFVLE